MSDVNQLLGLSKDMYIAAVAASQIDSPAIGPGDVVGAGIAVGATAVLAYAGVKTIVNYITDAIAQSKAKKENQLLVSHFTSVESANAILETGIIEPSKWEDFVYVMLEPATQQDAENAGAKYTEAKITFKINPVEVKKDPGTEQPGALQFNIPGSVNIENRNPVVTILE